MPLLFTCNVIVHVAFVAFSSKLAYADTLPLVLLAREAPTFAVFVDCGAIAPPSAVTAAAPGSGVFCSAANKAAGIERTIAAAIMNVNNLFFMFISPLHKKLKITYCAILGEKVFTDNKIQGVHIAGKTLLTTGGLSKKYNANFL